MYHFSLTISRAFRAVLAMAVAVAMIAVYFPPVEVQAKGAPVTRSERRLNTIEYALGALVSDDIGHAGNTRLAIGTPATVRLYEDNVVIENAYVVVDAQLNPGSNTPEISGYELAFDACTGNCTPDPWSGAGAIHHVDTTTLAYDESESTMVRLLLDVTNEGDLQRYLGASGGGIEPTL